MTVAFDAMTFAREKHKDQVRKYTGNPYVDHLAEVAGIVGTVFERGPMCLQAMAVAWLHDCVEDQGVQLTELNGLFGSAIADAVFYLSDMESGNRATRKQLSRDRLKLAPHWVQTIKCADLISNTPSIVKHDKEFARVYLEEKRLLLNVLTKADRRLWELALSQTTGSGNE